MFLVHRLFGLCGLLHYITGMSSSTTCLYGNNFCPKIQGNIQVVYCKECVLKGNRKSIVPTLPSEIGELHVICKALQDPEAFSYPRVIQDKLTETCWDKASVVGDGSVLPGDVWRLDAFGNLILANRIASISSRKGSKGSCNFSWNRHHRISRSKGGPTLPPNLNAALDSANFGIGDAFIEVGTPFQCGETPLSLVTRIFHRRETPESILGSQYRNVKWADAMHDGKAMLAPGALKYLKCLPNSKEVGKLLMKMHEDRFISGGASKPSIGDDQLALICTEIQQVQMQILDKWLASGRKQTSADPFDLPEMLPDDVQGQPGDVRLRKKGSGGGRKRRRVLGQANIFCFVKDSNQETNASQVMPSAADQQDDSPALSAERLNKLSNAQKLVECAIKTRDRDKMAADDAHGTRKESPAAVQLLKSDLALQSAQENNTYVIANTESGLGGACSGCGSVGFTHIFVNGETGIGLSLRNRVSYEDSFDADSAITRHFRFSEDTLKALSEDQSKDCKQGFSLKLMRKVDYQDGKYDGSSLSNQHRINEIQTGSSVANTMSKLAGFYRLLSKRHGQELQAKLRAYQALMFIRFLQNSYGVPEEFGQATSEYEPPKIKAAMLEMKDCKSIFDLAMWFPMFRTIDMPIRSLRFAKSRALYNACMLAYSELVCLLGQAGQDVDRCAKIAYEIQKYSAQFSPAWCGTPGLTDTLPFSDHILIEKLYSHLSLKWQDTEKTIMMKHGFLPVTFVATQNKSDAEHAYKAAKKRQLPVFSLSEFKNLESSLQSIYTSLRLFEASPHKYLLKVSSTIFDTWDTSAGSEHFPSQHVPILLVGGMLRCLDKSSSFLECSFVRAHYAVTLDLPSASTRFVFYHGVFGSVLPFLCHSESPNCVLFACGVETNTSSSDPGYVQVVLCRIKPICVEERLTINRNDGWLNNIWKHLGDQHQSSNQTSCSASHSRERQSGSQSQRAPQIQAQSLQHIGARSGRESGVTPLEVRVNHLVENCLQGLSLEEGAKAFQVMFIWGPTEPNFMGWVKGYIEEFLKQTSSNQWSLDFWVRPKKRSGGLPNVLQDLGARIDKADVVYIWADLQDIMLTGCKGGAVLGLTETTGIIDCIYAIGRGHKVFPDRKLLEHMEGKSGYMTELKHRDIPVKDFFVMSGVSAVAYGDFRARAQGWAGVVSKHGFSCLKRGVDFWRNPVDDCCEEDYIQWLKDVFSRFQAVVSQSFPLIVQQLDTGIDPDNADSIEHRLYFVNSTFIVSRSTSFASSAHCSDHNPCPAELKVALDTIRILGEGFQKSFSLVRIDLGRDKEGFFVNEVQVSSPTVENICGEKTSKLIARAVASQYVSLIYKALVPTQHDSQ